MSKISSKDNALPVPDNFICPLTLEIMTHPVMTRTGFNFERNALANWMNKGNYTCPLSRKPLGPSDIIPNHALAYQIRGWKSAKSYGYYLSDHTESTDDGDYDSSDSYSEKEEADTAMCMFAPDKDGWFSGSAEGRRAEQAARQERRRARPERRRQREDLSRPPRSCKPLVKWVRALTKTG